jgi:hypothetical protein
VTLLAIINKTLINPAPTLSSKAPANGAPNPKKIIDKTTLPKPIDVIMTIKLLANRTIRDVDTNPKSKAIKIHSIRVIEISYSRETIQ